MLLLSSSFAKVNNKTFPPTGGYVRVRENYLRNDVLLPHFLDCGEDCFFIIPTSSSLDAHFGEILACGAFTERAIILGSVCARLKALGYLKTLERVKKQVLINPTRGWVGLADDHLLSAITEPGDEPGLMRTTVRFLMTWFPQARFCVLSENAEFRSDMLARFPALCIQSVREFCAERCPHVIVVSAQEEENSSQTRGKSSCRKLVAANGQRRSGKLKCVNARKAFVGLDCLVVNCNHALHGDVVEIERVDGAAQHLEQGEADEDDMDSSAVAYQVVAIVKRDEKRRNLVCTLDAQQQPHTSNLVCVPMDVRFPKLIIPHSKLGPVLAGKRFLVEIIDWPEDCAYPNCKYLSTIGNAGELATESSCILHETGLHAHDLAFSAQALEELPKQVDFTPDSSSCHDMRDRRVVSIDPIGCQDIDDAISIERSEDGQWFELGVHIADVDRYVKSGSALDREASARATSVYLEERRLDMLPALLCEDICSLRPQVDRFAVSVIFTVDARTHRVDVAAARPKFQKSLIRSRFAMAYEQAQSLADGLAPGEYLAARGGRGWTGGPVPEQDWIWLREAVTNLMEIGRVRARERAIQGGAINLSNEREEVSFKPETSTSSVSLDNIKVNTNIKHLEIHDTVAELMILANEAVARQLLEADPTRALLRTHPPSADPIKFQACTDFCRELGIAFDFSSNKAIAASLDRVRAQCDKATAQYVESLTTRAMSEAQYVCAGTVVANTGNYSPFFHFGLGLSAYTHFTSPIRRYADLVVARQLFQVASSEPSVVEAASVLPAPSMDDVVAPPPIKAKQPEEEEEDLSWAMALGGSDTSSDEDDAPVFKPAAISAAPVLAPTPAPPQVAPQFDRHTHSSTQAVQAICDHINIQHRAAKEASHRSTELFLSLYLQAAPQRYMALISKIRPALGIITCFVPTFDLRVSVRLLRRSNGSNRAMPSGLDTESIILPSKAAMAHVSTVSFPHGDREISFDDGVLVYNLLDQVELELFVEPKDVTAPRIPEIQARLVLAPPSQRNSAAAAAIADKPFQAMVQSMKPNASTQPELLGARAKPSLFELFTKASAAGGAGARRREKNQGRGSAALPPSLPGARVCFGGYVPPPPTISLHSFAEDEGEEEEEFDASRHYLSRMSASSVSKAQLQQLEKDATRRMAKLQAEKFESRTKRRLKKGE